MKIDLDALEAVARAATPGPWHQGAHYIGAGGEPYDPEAVVGQASILCDAEHIAAFDPPTVLALIAKLREAERQRDASEKQVDIRSKDSIAARIARSNVRAVEEWAATQALVARQTRYIEELERVDSVELKAKLREAEAVIAQILDYEGPEAADMRDIALTYKPTNQEESAS